MKYYIESRNILSIKNIFDLCNQINIALIYLHTNGCCYGDLKPANILINKKENQLLFYLDFSESTFKYNDDLLSQNIYL